MIETIKSVAFEIGFDLVSVVSPYALIESEKNPGESQHPKKIDKQIPFPRHLDQKRVNPFLIESWVRSIIIVGVSYFNSFQFELPSEEYGRVSMYAWGRDYHVVVRSMLSELVFKLSKERKFSYKIFCDSTPLYEKGFAIAGRLGFQGKNTCVINPRIGSFFFIGEVLTDLDLCCEEAPEAVGECGKCEICVLSCPTGALTNYTLDPKKCISYLTIEYKDIIPSDTATKIGSWVFGCDICQRVCPFNKKLFDKKITPKITDFSLNLTPFLNLREIMKIPTTDQFKKAFREKAFIRAGRRGLLRNAIIVAVNNKAKKLKDEIHKLAKDNDEVISSTARRAVEEI